MKAKCVICSKVFDKRANRKTCSEECSTTLKEQYRKAYNKEYWQLAKNFYDRRVKIEYETRYCKECNAPFKANKKRIKIFCCALCKDRYHKRNTDTKLKSYKHRLLVVNINSNATNKNKKWSEKEIQILKRLRNNGKTYREIATELKRTYSSIKYACSEFKVELNRPISTKKLKERLDVKRG